MMVKVTGEGYVELKKGISAIQDIEILRSVANGLVDWIKENEEAKILSNIKREFTDEISRTLNNIKNDILLRISEGKDYSDLEKEHVSVHEELINAYNKYKDDHKKSMK